MKQLQVKNWAQFQHYGDRDPVWVKLYLSLLDDYDFAKLTDSERGQLLMIWLLASRTKGTLPHDERWIANRIQCSGRFRLQRFLDTGFLIVADAYQSSSNSLAVVEPKATLEKRRDREEERREETSPRVRGWDAFEAAVPEDYRDAVDGALRAANQPDALRRQLVAMQEAITGGPSYTPTQIAQALQELAVAGSRVTSAGLRAFCRRIAAGDREITTTTDAASAWSQALKGAA